MHIVLIGNTGQLGYELERTLAGLGSVTALDYPELDLNQPGQAAAQVMALQPQVIVNAAAYTAVDQAEANPEAAQRINAEAPGALAEVARRLGAVLVHYSTDYVFDGAKGAPYAETDSPHPLGEYGRSKLAGEQAVQQAGGAYLIFRTAWVYSLRRESFVSKVLGWSRQQETLRLVDDQVSSPTWCRALAEVSAQVLARGLPDATGWVQERSGLYHLAGSGYASRLAWGREILCLDPRAVEQRTRQILPAKTADFPTPAQRPLFSALDCSMFERTFGLRLPAWQTALRLAMQG
jgi:dTDP-4-dehydrorhamnose reductase